MTARQNRGVALRTGLHAGQGDRQAARGPSRSQPYPKANSPLPPSLSLAFPAPATPCLCKDPSRLTGGSPPTPDSWGFWPPV